jgi:hypothetical protein
MASLARAWLATAVENAFGQTEHSVEKCVREYEW